MTRLRFVTIGESACPADTWTEDFAQVEKMLLLNVPAS
jgi:hypothetical protein